MAGFNSITGDESIIYGDNISFDGTQRGGKLTTNGQLLIGSSLSPHIRVSTLTAGPGINITNGAGTITVGLTGGGIGIDSIVPNSGTSPIVPDSNGQITLVGTGSTTIVGSLNTGTVQLTGLTNHAIQIGSGTATLTQLGAGTTGQILQTNTAADPTWSTATYPSTATGTGTILRADGTNWVASTATYPNTAGTSGNLLTSDGTNWVSTTSIIPAAPNVALNFFDDFLYSAATADFTATGTRYGQWSAILSGTTKSITPQGTTTSVIAGRPGIMTISTSSSGATCSLGMINNNSGNIKMATNGVITATWYFNINALSNGTDTYTMQIGLSSTTSPGSGDSVHFSYTHSVNSGQWVCNTALGGGGTARNSTTAVATGYQVLQIVWTPGSQAAYFTGTTLANLTSIVTPVATNLPTAQCSPIFVLNKTLGAGAVSMDLDLFTLNQTFTTAR